MWFPLFGDTGGPGACSSLPLRPCPLPPPLNCSKLLAGECVLCASFHGVCAERPCSLLCLGPSRLTHFPPETFASPSFSGMGVGRFSLSFSTLLFLLSEHLLGHKVIPLVGGGLLHRTAHAFFSSVTRESPSYIVGVPQIFAEFHKEENPFLLFSLFWAEGDIDILLDKFHQENQGHISSSLTASSVTKSASLDVGGAPTCTSEW